MIKILEGGNVQESEVRGHTLLDEGGQLMSLGIRIQSARDQRTTPWELVQLTRVLDGAQPVDLLPARASWPVRVRSTSD